MNLIKILFILGLLSSFLMIGYWNYWLPSKTNMRIRSQDTMWDYWPLNKANAQPTTST